MSTHPPRLIPDPPLPRKSGMVLWVVTLVLAALAIVGTTIYSVAHIDVAMCGHHKKAVTAFYNAEAGVRYVALKVNEDVESGSLVLGDPVESVNYPPPVGYNFDPVTQLIRMPDNESYLLTVVGRAQDGQATVEAVLAGDGELPFGFFGDDRISMGPGTELHAYDSDLILDPLPTDCTGDTRAGTNVEMGGTPGAVHGNVTLGKDLIGNQASYVNAAPPTTVTLSERVNSDPLGAFGGGLASDFLAIQTVNDNGSAIGATGQPDGSIEIINNVTLTAGDYWVSEIDLANHMTLLIDASAGPVNIYLTGGAFTASQANIVTSPSVPNNLHIFSNSSETIEFKPGSSFVGTIYAPAAQISMAPSGKFMGAAWGWQLNLSPGNGLYHDATSSFGKETSDDLQVVSWQQVQ